MSRRRGPALIEREARVEGFTLLELLVVVIIIVLLAGAAVAMYGNFMRGQGARQGSMIMIQTIARATQLSADQRVMHFIVFSNAADGGLLMIHRDANSNGQYEAGTDQPVESNAIELPKFCDFEKAPLWMGFNPSRYVVYSANALPSGAFTEVQAGTFDGQMAGSAPSPVGDIIVRMRNEPYRVCMDVDRASGKIRRHQFLAQ